MLPMKDLQWARLLSYDVVKSMKRRPEVPGYARAPKSEISSQVCDLAQQLPEHCLLLGLEAVETKKHFEICSYI